VGQAGGPGMPAPPDQGRRPLRGAGATWVGGVAGKASPPRPNFSMANTVPPPAARAGNRPYGATRIPCRAPPGCHLRRGKAEASVARTACGGHRIGSWIVAGDQIIHLTHAPAWTGPVLSSIGPLRKRARQLGCDQSHG
jgi:hypothetical protein